MFCFKRNRKEEDTFSLLGFEDSANNLLDMEGVQNIQTTSFAEDDVSSFQNFENKMKAFFENAKNAKYKSDMIKMSCAGDVVLTNFYRDLVLSLTDTFIKLEASRNQSLGIFKGYVSTLLNVIIMHASKDNSDKTILDDVLACQEFLNTVKDLPNTPLGKSLKSSFVTLVEAREREKAPGDYFSNKRAFKR